MNISNKLTLSRLVLAFVMTFFLSFPVIPFGKTLALITFVVAAITDYWDGRLARNDCGITVFGQLMDPLADKVIVCAAFISFVSIAQIVPAWIVVIIITRELLVTGLRILAANRGQIIPAGSVGKQKTIWQIIAIITIILGMAVREDILPLLLTPQALGDFLTQYYNRYFSCVTHAISGLVAVVTVVSGWLYFRQCKDWVMNDA